MCMYVCMCVYVGMYVGMESRKKIPGHQNNEY